MIAIIAAPPVMVGARPTAWGKRRAALTGQARKGQGLRWVGAQLVYCWGCASMQCRMAQTSFRDAGASLEFSGNQLEDLEDQDMKGEKARSKNGR